MKHRSYPGLVCAADGEEAPTTCRLASHPMHVCTDADGQLVGAGGTCHVEQELWILGPGVDEAEVAGLEVHMALIAAVETTAVTPSPSLLAWATRLVRTSPGKAASILAYCVRHGRGDKRAALEAALAAAVRCRICGRTLTDPASKAAGIGPDCAARLVAA